MIVPVVVGKTRTLSSHAPAALSLSSFWRTRWALSDATTSGKRGIEQIEKTPGWRRSH